MTTLSNPRLDNLHVGVVSHDAGAANMIFGWLQACHPRTISANLSGPAIRIAEASGLKIKRLGPESIDNSLDLLITGTSFSSEDEHNARTIAREKGVRCIGVIDHWVNYKERFIFQSQECLPSEIWVGDQEAFVIAEASFPRTRVHLYKNNYTYQTLRRIKEYDELRRTNDLVHVLYVLEPFRRKWVGQTNPDGEFAVLDFWLQNWTASSIGKNATVRLRPHPSDVAGKYDQWIAVARLHCDIALDHSDSLEKSISWSDIVLGCESNAMAIALKANRIVITTIPPNAGLCRLPHSNILRLTDFLKSK